MDRSMYQDRITIEGVSLDILAEDIGGGGWQLSIENHFRVRTTWDEFFDSPEAALQEGRRAIEQEGVGEFLNVEGFG